MSRQDITDSSANNKAREHDYVHKGEVLHYTSMHVRWDTYFTLSVKEFLRIGYVNGYD